MSRPQGDPLRPLEPVERSVLERLSRSRSAPASQVARAVVLLAVAQGASYTAAARAVGRRSNEAVAHLVAHFNREGLSAIEPAHGGGARVQYGMAERGRILGDWRRSPDRERDGTATRSVTTLQRALRRAPDGLPAVSTHTIWKGLHAAGVSWQRDRSWCETGRARRRRKRGEVVVVDPDAAAKKR